MMPGTDLYDAMSGVVILRHVWRQKAVKLYTCKQLPNFGIRALKCNKNSSYCNKFIEIVKSKLYM